MARDGITFEMVAACRGCAGGRGGGSRRSVRCVSTWEPAARTRSIATSWPGEKHALRRRPRRSNCPRPLAAALANEIERAAAAARAEVESRLVQTQSEAADLSAAGEALEAERDELVEQVVALTTERDTLAGKAQQQAVDLAEAQQRIEREQQAAESARVEVATAPSQDRGAG
jgi:colicin import membrane protein